MPTNVPFRTGSVLVRAVTVFVLTVGFVGAGAWVPTQSRDEAATVSSVTRTWSQLEAMLGHVDVVHALYYATMKLWLDEVGITNLTLRAPSVLACGLAAALVVVLGSLLLNPRAGLLSGLVLMICPRATKAATEGRSAAWFMAAAVVLVLVVVLSVRRPSWWLWVLPAALAMAVLGGLSVYAVLLVPILVGYLVVAPGPGVRRAWRLWLLPGRWSALLGIAVGLVPVARLAELARDQQSQVDFLEAPNLDALSRIATDAVAPLNPLWAVGAWIVAAAGLVWLSARRRHLGATAFLLVGWVGFPGLALLLASALWIPLYSPRYLAFCVGGLALLVGAGLASVRRSWLAVGLVVGLTAAGLVSYRTQRAIDAWDDWAQIMKVIAYQATPGDVVIDYPLVSTLTVSYPDGLAGLPVLNAGASRISREYLWDDRLPLRDVERKLVGVRRIWYLAPSASLNDDVRRDADLARLRQLGFRRTTVQKSTGEQTYLLTRSLADAEQTNALTTPG